ncbi:MAG TPA: Crp/Fnr family transcriptional regulator [Steroidobacteraceae bacterium]|nr:Crp/Fnr family transcriptional regulator [Steroidobacteraceae bacterium]
MSLEHAGHLLRRLQGFCPLDDEERGALLAALCMERRIGAHACFVEERCPPEGIFAILEGIACRYKLLPDGRRQIVGLMLPGDVSDLGVLLLRRMDHSIATLSPVTVAWLPPASALSLLERHPRLARALWWAGAVEESITREWVVNIGQRTALQRTAHLLCEVFWRLESLGLTQDNACVVPLTQAELGDMLALSAVHVNRTLMCMRRTNLAELHGGRLQLLDRHALEAVAGFDPVYLHLRGGAM